MQNLESCIIKMSEVSALIRMIDDTFVDGRVGFADERKWKAVGVVIESAARRVWKKSC